MWVVTKDGFAYSPKLIISIHTTHVGGDKTSQIFCVLYIQFQSTPPMWVVTVQNHFQFLTLQQFQSTPPMWVVTPTSTSQLTDDEISIHTTHVGGDFSIVTGAVGVGTISIHTTHVGGDFQVFSSQRPQALFQSTPPMWVVTF